MTGQRTQNAGAARISIGYSYGRRRTGASLHETLDYLIKTGDVHAPAPVHKAAS